MVLPKVGTKVEQGKEFGEVESVKAVSSLYSPVSGEVIAVNSDLPNRLETLGSDPYGEGWLVEVVATEPERELARLIQAPAEVTTWFEAAVADFRQKGVLAE